MTHNKRRPLACTMLIAISLLAPVPAISQDAALYDNITNPDASFVRVIVEPLGLGAVQGTPFEAIESGVSPYVVIDEPGEVSVAAGSVQGSLEVAAGGFYTYALASDGTANVITDTITRSPGQADVAFYNLSDIPSADLFVPAANAVAIAEVAAGEAGAVALKAPLTLDFEARQGDEVLGSVSAVDLRRREGVTLTLRGKDGSYVLRADANALKQ